MKLKPKFTHEEHVKVAQRFCKLTNEVRDLLSELEAHYGKSSRMCKKLTTALRLISISVRSELDDEYHKVTSDKQFAEKGHAYYKSDVFVGY